MKLHLLLIYHSMQSGASAKTQKENDNFTAGCYSNAKLVLQKTATAVCYLILTKSGQD